jgi:hypothetical protein
LETTRGDIIALLRGLQPPDKGLDHEVEDERGERVSLESASPNLN